MVKESYFQIGKNNEKRSLNHQLNEMFTTLKQILRNLKIAKNIMNDNPEDIILHIEKQSLNNVENFFNQYNEIIEENPKLDLKFANTLYTLKTLRNNIEKDIKLNKIIEELDSYIDSSLNITDTFYKTFKEELKQFQLKSNQ